MQHICDFTLSASAVLHVHGGWGLSLNCTAAVKSLILIWEQMWSFHCTHAKGGLQLN